MKVTNTVSLDFDSLNRLDISNLSDILPKEFYNIENYNRIGLSIYNNLNLAFTECNKILRKTKI